MEHVINRDQIMHLVKYTPPGKLPEALVKYLSEHMRITDLVLDAIQTRDDRHTTQLAELSLGLETAFNSFMSVAYDVVNEDIELAIDPVKVSVDTIIHRNYATLAMIFKARNPRGDALQDSPYGKYFFDKFLEMAASDKRSESWESITPGMKEYVDLCLTKSLLEQEQLND